MAAELRLGVSFDLVYFRQQLQKLNQIAASEFSTKVKLGIDKRDFQRQFNALTKELKINVNDSQLVGARERLTNLNKGLATFRRQSAQPIVIKFKYEQQGQAPAGLATGSSTFRQRLTNLGQQDKAALQQLYKAAGRASLLAFDAGIENNKARMVKALGDVGEDSIQGLLNGLKSKDSDLKSAAKGLGNDLIRSIKDVLGIASPSREFKKIGEDSGEGLEQGLKSGIGEAGDVGVREIEKLFKRLQREAKAGSAVLQAIMAGAMSGVIKLPGTSRGAGGSIGPTIRRQRAQVQAERQAQTGGTAALIAGMMSGVIPMGGTPRGAGGSIGPMIRQQRAQVRAERQAQTGSTAALMLGMMSGVIPMPGTPRGAGGSISGLIEQERAKVRERNQPQRVAGIIAALASARGNLSPAAGVNQRLAGGGVVNPGVLSSGYIGRSAISPGFVNYPAGMPPAYATGFIEPTSFGSLAAGTVGRYGMGDRPPQFPVSPMMRGGIGAGGGSFVPTDTGRSVGRLQQSLIGLTQKVRTTADAVRRELMPTFGDMRREVIDVRRSVATSFGAEGGYMGGSYMSRYGNIARTSTGFPTSGMATASSAGIVPGTSGGSMGRFPRDGMIYPSSPLGRITAQSSMFGGGGPGGGPGGGGGGGGFSGKAVSGFGEGLPNIQVPNLPGRGLVREIGNEFAFAAKQVVLFGATYKALAFLTSFPAQVGQAVGALQSYRNTLDAITPSAQEAERSNALILELVDKYNVPLQSAREGFTRLYASMQPAGFAGEDIENIFTGITQASATFGLSADKVDRVNYAFAQMASKGQIMSEELKGQLGDVLPGAMAIFAEAAGYEGPAAIQDFSAALEDGRFKGEAMVALLKNVGVVMQKEFGPGAEGAARTFQGVLNRMQTSLTLLYESFEPVAVDFLNSFVVPLTQGIKTVSDGVTAFLSGTQAKSAAGSALAKQLEELRPAFDGIRQNIQTVLPALGQFAELALGLGKALLQIAGNPIVGYLARLYLVALPVSVIFGKIVTIFGAVRTALVNANVALLTGTQRFTTYRVIMDATGISAAKLSATLRVMSPIINGVSIALRALAGPAILLGISAIIERFMMLKGAIDDVRRSTATMLGSISTMANSGAVGDLKNIGADTAKQVKTFEQLKPFVSGGALGPAQKLTPAAAKKMRELGLGGFLGTDIFGKDYVRDSVNASNIIEERLKSLNKIAGNVKQKLPLAQKIAADIAARTKPQEVTPLPASAGEGEDGKEGKERESQVPQLKLRLELARKLFEFDKAIASAQLAGNTVLESRLQLSRDLTEIDFERRQILLETIPDEEKRLKIAELGLKQEETILKSQLNLRLQLQQEFEKTQKAFADILLGYKEEADFQQRYYDLVQRGINPALARTTVEVEKRFAQELKSLQAQLDQQELGVATLELEIERAKVAGTLSEIQKKELEDAKERLEILKKEIDARKQLKGETPEAINEAIGEAQKAEAPKPFGVAIAEEYENIKNQLKELTSAANLVVFSANSIGDAFGQAFKDIVTGAENWRDALGNAFRSIASQFADLVAQILAKAVALQIIGLFLPGAGSPGGAASPSASAARGTPGATAPNGAAYFGPAFANGGIAAGGFRAFASGGVVTGPTLGLVGEGRFNEAVVPLPDGKKIPVDLGGNTGNNISTNIVVNVNNGQASSQTNGSGRGGQALGRELEGAVRNVILKETRPGGLIYNAR